jgi:hypothetical protein
MSGNERQIKLIHSVLAQDEENRLLELLDYLEKKIPAEYRKELLSFLLPRTISGERMDAAGVAPRPEEEDVRPASPAPDKLTVDEKEIVRPESYRALFARRGDTLLKALATMRFAETQLEVRWLNPMEIVRLLGELDDTHRIYRSNVSNVLRKEENMVARRPRGRGYEYGLTKAGRARVMRELSLLGIDR